MPLRYLRHPPSRRALRRLNPRQLKKLRLGEHRVVVVHLEVVPRAPTPEAFDAALAALLRTGEARGIHVAAGGLPEEQLIDASCGRETGSLDVAAAVDLVAALRARPEIDRVDAIEMADGWWGHGLQAETEALLGATRQALPDATR